MSEEVLSFEEAIEKYDPVLGFEVHVELNTNTKMFDAAPNVFGDEPNTNITPVSLGLPGVLPVVNKVAVESAIKLGLALGCDIAPISYFARKNYFYPDSPKNFQTSQHHGPIAENGKLDVELEDGTVFTVEIERAHMEEDAGKLTHVGELTGIFLHMRALNLNGKDGSVFEFYIQLAVLSYRTVMLRGLEVLRGVRVKVVFTRKIRDRCDIASQGKTQLNS